MIGGTAIFSDGSKIVEIPRILILNKKEIKNLDKNLEARIKAIYIFPKDIEKELLFSGFERKSTKVSLRSSEEMARLSRKIQVNIQLYGIALMTLLTITISFIFRDLTLTLLLASILLFLHFLILKKSREDLKKMVSETEKSIWNYRFSIANHLARIALRYGKKVKLESIKGKRYVVIEWELLPYFSEHLIVRE